MGKIFEFLGLTVGCITHDISDAARKKAYASDITYGTNNEFGFDYLRDNMKFTHEQLSQRPFNFAVIDEVDSILIDEARTPLIISGPTEDNSELYNKINKLIPKLGSEDFEKDEKSRTVTLTEAGTNKVEELLIKAGLLEQDSNLYDLENVHLIHHINQALKAHQLFSKDTDYMIKNNQILIIDDFTGRALEGRRYSEGLHQALEAKENVTVQNENQTLASVTFQNYFRLYPKISGMTGTAMTEAEEFFDIYKLDVVEIPPNKPKCRKDEEDEIYRTAEEKYQAIITQIEESHKQNQPVLVGTVSIEKSELISSMLKKKKIKHHVLNAKYHEEEAFIISQAGVAGAVTIATNMAGRGTDIMLGGNAEMLIAGIDEKLSKAEYDKKVASIKSDVQNNKNIAIAAGGLFVIGTERHESRRIDNQLRGRSGRQGDPGKSKFYLSLEDDLMRIFASERIGSILQKLGLGHGEAIYHPMISKALERAQQKVESRNFEIRKNLLRYDDVASEQRKVIYEQRSEIMASDNLSEMTEDMWKQLNEELVRTNLEDKSCLEEADIESLEREVFRIYGVHESFAEFVGVEVNHDAIITRLDEIVEGVFVSKAEEYSKEVMQIAEKRFLLLTLDQLWKDHLHALDHLRQGINLRAYGQKDPLNEYKREAFGLFEQMLGSIRELAVTRLAHMHLKLSDEDGSKALSDYQPKIEMHESRIDPAEENLQSKITSFQQEAWGKVGRNEKCPCGSEKKYKQCHGRLVSGM
ncbi:unnamed protein product [Sphagnum jensenii]|uniref:Protein translocase subunit SecA n=1 Tax=Sphagnum jensenii TaxID=128206 RepID=A0ABP0VFN3_9BRYO